MSMDYDDQMRAENALRQALIGVDATYVRLYLTDAWFKSMIDGQVSFIVQQVSAYATHSMVQDGERRTLILDKMREGFVSKSWIAGLD